MAKKNCWEIKKCGREPAGVNVAELGICPATIEVKLDGTNSGMNAGRACWAIAGTLCAGELQGTPLQKLARCQQCEVFQIVVQEEGSHFEGARVIQAKLKGEKQEVS